VRLVLSCSVGLLLAAAPALADHRGGLEAAVELDSNIRRTDGSAEQPNQRAPATRLGGRLDLTRAAPGQGQVGLSAAAQLRTAVLSDVTSDNVATLSVDSQGLWPVRAGELRVGPRLAYRDAIALADAADDRAFRSASADLVLVLLGEASRATLSAGPRLFQYKLTETSTWLGGGATLRGDIPLWQSDAADERSLELVAVASYEQRAYRAKAFTNNCAPTDPLTERCFLPTLRRRGDRVHQLTARLQYSGGVVASVEEQLTVVDSNSLGRSWVGSRLRALVTAPVGAAFLTGAATLQLERFVDGMVVARDPDAGLFDTLEDDNRSSLEGRLALPLGEVVTLEARAAVWRALFGAVSYRRSLASLGLVWAW
jgi:hypothetical protein